MIIVSENTIVIGFILIILLTIGIYVGYLFVEAELVKREQRIIQLANMLQVAETRTGYPFYTSVLLNAYSFEQPEQVYMKLRQKLNSIPVMERHAPAHHD